MGSFFGTTCIILQLWNFEHFPSKQSQISYKIAVTGPHICSSMHPVPHSGACLPETFYNSQIRVSIAIFNGCVKILEKLRLKYANKPLEIIVQGAYVAPKQMGQSRTLLIRR